MENWSHGCQGGWHKHPASPVLGGNLGTCFDISMVAGAEEIRMYFSWRDRHSIALTVSLDGIHWSEPEICIAPRETPEGWEDHLNRPAVLRRGSLYHMWYTGQYLKGHGEGTSDIFHAISEDGVYFTRTDDQPVLRPEEPWEKKNVMCPCVQWDEEKKLFRMWYSAGEQYEPNAIGYAESPDGYHWHRPWTQPIFQANPELSWERHKVTGCHVFYQDGWYWMFYIGFHDENYAQIGIARSRDGVSGWERSTHNPIIAPDPGAWDGEACYKPFVLPWKGQWMLWYNGRTGHKEQIGLAIQDGEKLRF